MQEVLMIEVATLSEAATTDSPDMEAPSPRFHGQRMTPEEFAALPDDDQRYEYIQGEVRAMSPAGGRHGRIGIRIASLLDAHLYPDEGHVYDSSTGYRLPNGDVLSPDVSVILAGRLPDEVEPIGFIEIPPELAVEIISPSDRYADVLEKVQIYLNWGVSAVWVVEPEQRQIMVHTTQQIERVHGDDARVVGDAVPGFSAQLDEIFPAQRSAVTNP
jgi:Uma2 family endonuclease